MRRSLAAVAVTAALFASSSRILAADDLSDLAFHPHPGAQLPLAVPLTDESGAPVELAQFFTGAPVVLVLEYLRCKSLCGLTLEDIVTDLDGLSVEPGRDFQLVAISIDPRDGPAQLAAAKANYLAHDRHAGAADAFHFLGGSESAVRSIADSVGFPYRRDPELDQYIHPAGFVVAAPDGRISRYLLGVGTSAAELRAALDDARQGRSMSPLTRLLLLCHGEGTVLGRYTVPVLAAFTAANLGAVAALVAWFAAIRMRRER